MKVFYYYLLIINLYGFIIMYIDKKKSIKGKWRISEKNLFLTALAFGSIGIFLGMQLFRHKTKHKSFTLGIPCIFILQMVSMVYAKNILF
ncbi:DUF1294 domain-containing protein [Clostridium sp. MSJ-11]|uniref:DUF1294 domain-containing protein n=1 Tax=Clostridium mobile TaxID=2841512 RepID=A0ABS6EHR2_9CLOT|nr:DUF1294 domain-containing protein [Clostridium mobile]MBU5484744.1 DUF1294 domain-containing protein [Clostridium mobile]